jgi:hypothetical protein
MPRPAADGHHPDQMIWRPALEGAAACWRSAPSCAVLLRELGDFSLHPQGRPCGCLYRDQVACALAGPASRHRRSGVNRPAAIEEAAAVFQALVTAHGLRVEELTAPSAWQVFVDYSHVAFATADLPDADGLLYQYGMYPHTGQPLFELDLVRQFEVVDAEDEHDHYVHMHCTLRYAPTPELQALGADHCWWFPARGR